MKHRLCRKSVCGGAPESLCVEGRLTSAMTLVKKNTHCNACKAFRIFRDAFVFLEEVRFTNIYECAVLYQTLLNKKYIFTLEDNITFTLEFKKDNFHHLLGLHKLTDQQVLLIDKPQNTPAKIYDRILNQEITVKTIETSTHYHKIENRIKYFEKIFDTLDKSKCKIIIDFDPSKIENCSLRNTKYILYVRMPEGYFLFTLGDARNKKIYPETMFFEPSNMYNNQQRLLDVIDINIIEKKAKK